MAEYDSRTLFRFWAKVNKHGPNGCWTWIAGRFSTGYGQFWAAGKNHSTHRFVWEITNGPIPEGQGSHGTCVLHRCDNRICVNPSHLFLGSIQDNVADRGQKRRHRVLRGEACPWSRLNDAEILKIRSDPRIQREVALELGVSRPLISRIRNQKIWAHVRM